MGQFTGKNAKKHPELIIDYLKILKAAVFYSNHALYHRYPHAGRCKTELVWKIALEWYIAMDKPEKVRQDS